MLCASCANEVPPSKARELYPDALDYRGALKHLENTNTPATDADVSLVSSTVLPAIQNKRDELLACIRRLQDACSVLNVEEAHYKRLISPCRRLPPEILSEIFQHACISNTDDLAEFPDSGSVGIFNPQAAQWTIPRVCVSWRTVVLNCQAIWSTIRVIEPHYPRCFGSKHVDALTLALSRSGNHLLDVALNERHYGFWVGSATYQIPHPSPYQYCRILFDMIFAESHRWRSAVLYLSGKGTRNAFVSLRGRLPNLTNLALRVTESEITTPIVITGFSDCPRLHSVDLQHLVEIDIQWSQILHLVLTGNMLHENMRQVLQVVDRCKAARSFKLDRPRLHGEFEDLTRAHTITNASIHTLDVSHPHFIDHLILPELREVICTDHDGESENGFLDTIPCLRSLTHLLERSECAVHLTSLRLRVNVDPNSDQNVLWNLLYTTSNLTTLDLELTSCDGRDDRDDEDCEDNNGDLGILALLDIINPKQTPVLLPVINSISVVLHGHDDEHSFHCLDHHENLADMLRIRWKPEEDPVFGARVGRLQKFKLWVHAKYLDDAEFDRREVGRSKGYRLPAASKQALQDLVDDGMDLSIRVTTTRIERGQDYVRLAIG